MILILTALETEYLAVRKHLVDIKPRRHRKGTAFEVGVNALHPCRKIALALTGMGNLAAATITERAIGQFNPAVILFVGIAGALGHRLKLGDVIVATRVYAYQGGLNEADKFLARPRAWEISHRIEQTALQLRRADKWRTLLPAPHDAEGPTVWFEPIAAGEVVMDSSVSVQAQQLRSHYNDAVAVEMEGAGFALAAHLNGNIPMAAVRAISDHADGTKTATDRAGWQPVAARNAAAFVIALAAAIEDVDSDDAGAAGGPAVPAVPPIRNTNVARDHAQVNQQNGINFGAYHPGSHRTGDGR